MSSKIQISPYRLKDNLVLKIELFLDFKNHEFAMIYFKCDNFVLDVLSTSKGNISYLDKSIKTQDSNIEIFVEYCFENKIECLIGYYTKNELLNNESLVTNIDFAKKIEFLNIEIPHICSIPGNYKDKFNDFIHAIERRVSNWKITISCPDDITLNINSTNKEASFFVFGEKSQQPISSDLEFKLYPNTTKINIPKEIIRNNYTKYSSKTELGVYEIIKPDFLGKNVYYKVLVSNTLLLEGLLSKDFN